MAPLTLQENLVALHGWLLLLLHSNDSLFEHTIYQTTKKVKGGVESLTRKIKSQKTPSKFQETQL